VASAKITSAENSMDFIVSNPFENWVSSKVVEWNSLELVTSNLQHSISGQTFDFGRTLASEVTL